MKAELAALMAGLSHKILVFVRLVKRIFWQLPNQVRFSGAVVIHY
jgi:hypothetical protein